MVTSPTRRRPRVRFETVLPTPSAELPRMDVAAFVGFAASGPIDTPVLVEDPAVFREIFGGPVPLAADEARSTTVWSYLAEAVDGFFDNGGRRAWVVRVAGRPARTQATPPVAHAFELPGLFDGEGLAAVRARSEGSWCEALSVAAFERTEPLAVEGFITDAVALAPELAGRVCLTLRPGSPEPERGDLCRLVFAAAGVTLLLEVDEVRTSGERRRVLSDLRPPDAFVHDLAPLPAITEVIRTGATRREGWPLPSAHALDAQGLRLEYPAGQLPEVRPGDPLLVRFAGGSTARVSVTEVDAGLVGAGASSAVPAFVRARAPLWSLDAAAALALVGAEVPRAAIVRLGLSVFEGEILVHRVDDLGLTERHPRFFGRLPMDRALYLPQSSTRAEPVDAALAALAVQPRLPVAGPSTPAARYLPVGLPPGPSPTFARATLVSGAPEDRLVRDGLDVFGADLFLDEHLTPYGAGTIARTAEHLVNVAHLDLVGLHALATVPEVSMVAAPDAAHRAWTRALVHPIELLDAPTLDNLPLGSDTLVWTAVARSSGYRLEVSKTPDFAPAGAVYEGPDLTVAITPEGCADLRYYRVRAETSADVGPWSNTVALRVPSRDFAPCVQWRDDVPSLTLLASPPSAVPTLEWPRVVPVVGETWQLEQSEEPGFLGPTTVYSGPATSAEIPFGPEGPRYFRVRAVRGGVFGAWSNTVIHLVDSRQPAFALEAESTYEASTRSELLAVQRALLRFVAGRGDTTALLSGPRHDRPAGAAEHVRRLVLPGAPSGATRPVAALSAGEQGVLAHGAMLSPWVVSGARDVLEAVPPDGVIAGSVAARTIARGAWIAPANQPLFGLLGTAPRVPAGEADAAIEAGVNVIEADPRGFVLRTAYTLSSDAILVDLSAARLLHLLRRWLAGLGQTYVFEPNGRRLASRVKDDLEAALTRLWARGALAGARPSQAFEVVTGGRLQDRHARDAGRFVVEVRFAPSRPLTFLLVRLVETDLRALRVQVS